MSLKDHNYVIDARLDAHQANLASDPGQNKDWLYWLGATYAHEYKKCPKLYNNGKPITSDMQGIFEMGYQDAQGELEDKNGD